MNTAKPDPETPIFGEVRHELGIPEIDVHDFEKHQQIADAAEESGNLAAVPDDTADSPEESSSG